jgi:myosin-5
VSGESGAGKTEASKQVMHFLIAANDFAMARAEVSKGEAEDTGDRIRRVLTESSVILEAFGNAKTVRNDNSSRFGKYINLQYMADNQLVAAYTETFLLEKSRLVSVGRDERNYHVLYQLVRGLQSTEAERAQRLGLRAVEDFKILTEGGCTLVGAGVGDEDDAAGFASLQRALEALGCSKEEKQGLWEVPACVLHLGNITFSALNNENERVELDLESFSFEEVANLLGVPEAQLRSRMAMQKVQAGNRDSVRTKILSLTDVQNNVMALVKYLYRSTFSWLVRKINYSHGGNRAFAGNAAEEKSR